MNDQKHYISLSLELHLFFARIMKEHAIFLKAGFTPKDSAYADKAEEFQLSFENLLCETVKLSGGNVGCTVLNSGEVITEFTALAEEQTEYLTGIHINQSITEMESGLHCGCDNCDSDSIMCQQVEKLNQTAITLLDGLIEFKEEIINNVLHCSMFTMNYPLLLEHILREAKLYRMFVCNYESGMHFDLGFMRQTEQFWNQIMMEHALFIRGLLDPTEDDLITASDGFAQDYATLLARARAKVDQTLLRRESLAETLKFRDFKIAGTKGTTECSIHSVILPLLADHVLREANHYIRLLRF